MKSILTKIFVTLGVIFTIIILGGIYFFITDPFNLKPLIFGSHIEKTMSDSVDTLPSVDIKLSEPQKEVLINVGVDPVKIPSSISGAQESCFVSVLGSERVAEIKAGAVPSAAELLKGKSCVQ